MIYNSPQPKEEEKKLSYFCSYKYKIIMIKK